MRTDTQSETLARLARLIQRVENRAAPTGGAVPTGWPLVDAALADESAPAGLSIAGAHEFLLASALDGIGPGGRNRPAGPLLILAHLARQSADAIEGVVVWVGRRCWPNPQLLDRLGLVRQSMFVEAEAPAPRLWAIESAMRSPAVTAVVGDAAGFRLPATRRLELAGRSARGLVLLARPPDEAAVPTAARTRWLVRPEISDSLRPRWTLELVRCKSRQSAHGRAWLLEWDRDTSAVVVSDPMGRRRRPAPTAADRRSALG